MDVFWALKHERECVVYNSPYNYAIHLERERERKRELRKRKRNGDKTRSLRVFTK